MQSPPNQQSFQKNYMINPLVLSAAAQRIESACYIGTIVDSMTWRQAKYPAPDRPFGRPGGQGGMRPRRGLLKLLRLLVFCPHSFD